MTPIELFAFVLLPLGIAAAGSTIGYLCGRSGKPTLCPGE